MEDLDNQKEFVGELQKKNDPIEEWPTNKLKKEAEDGQGQGQSIQRDDHEI